MNLLSALLRPEKAPPRAGMTLDDLFASFRHAGGDYPLLRTTLGGITQPEINPEGLGFAAFLDSNPIVAGVVNSTMQLFSEAVFKYQPLGTWANGDLYGNPSLLSLEEPWPGGDSRALLSLMSVYEQIAGQAFVWREDARTRRVLRPDWMTIVLGTRRADGEIGDPDTEVIGYAYKPPGGRVWSLPREMVAQFFTLPDPVCQWRGRSWLRPVLAEVAADNAATLHKRMFFENGATANTVVKLDGNLTPEEFDAWVDRFEEGHAGAINAYKRIYLAGGADAKVIGANMEQVDFVNTQGHGEARICVAAGMPPVLANVVKGLDSATYSNYGQAKQVWADGRIRPMWGKACAALAWITDVPKGSRLWYDDRQIPYLQDDRKKVAEVQNTQAQAIRTLVDAGFTPESVVLAIESGDLNNLKHTHLFSVQLQPPGITPPAPASTSRNGNGNGSNARARELVLELVGRTGPKF